MDLSYFQKINNTYKSSSKQETDLFLLNKHVSEHFADTIDYQIVKRNDEPFELLIIKDTEGNTFKKKIKSKHENPFNLGDYIEWNGQQWLVTLLNPDDKTYHSGYMCLCTIPLYWQNSNGKIVKRYAYAEDFTKYSTGVIGNNNIQVGENQYGLTLPIDTETMKLKRDMRFAIDIDGVDEPDIYSLTNRKTKLNDNIYFGRGGVMIVTMSLDSFNKEADKYVKIDGNNYVWICNYNQYINNVDYDNDSPTPISYYIKITAPSYSLRPNKKNFALTAQLYTSENIPVEDEIVYEWSLSSDVMEYITYRSEGNKMFISLSDECEDFGDEVIVTCVSKYTGQEATITMFTKEEF